ncbi:MAG: GNAT family N-acetyltransferase, partial [Acidimicrobiia bacterium]
MPTVRALPTDEMPSERLSEVRLLLDAAFRDDPDGEFTDDDWLHTIGGLHVVLLEKNLVVAHAAVVHRVVEVAGVPLRTGYVEG